MGTRKVFPLDTHLNLMDEGSVNQVIYRKMVLFVGSCWIFIRTCLFWVFGFLNRYSFRFRIESSSKMDDSNCDVLNLKEDEIGAEKDSRCSDGAAEVIDSAESEDDGFGEKKSSLSFSFKFQLQSPEDIRRSIEESDVHGWEEKISTQTTEMHQYRFLGSKDFAGFTEEPEIMSFSVKESYIDSEGDYSSSTKEAPDIEFEDGFSLDKDFKHMNSEAEALTEELLTNSCAADVFKREEEPENSKALHPTLYSEIHTSGGRDMIDEVSLVSEKGLSGCDSDPESMSLSDGLSVMNPITDSDRNEFLSEMDVEGFTHETDLLEFMQISAATCLRNSFALDMDSDDFSDVFSPINSPIDVYKLYLSDTESLDFSDVSRIDDSVLSSELLSERDFPESERGSDDFNGGETESMDELQESERNHLANSQIPEAGTSSKNQTSDANQSDGFQSEKDFGEPKHELEDSDGNKAELTNDADQLGGTQSENLSNSDYDDSDGLEYLWEHQDLMEQLKMELKNVRATGLPTIMEELESPRVTDDLKPWKMDEKFLQEDPMDELQKFYKSYRERMRKFDILNFQKMYAIGFLQLKDPLQSIASRKSSTPTLASLLSQNLRRRRHRKSDTDPTAKFIKELQSDLETVYVGQACLSWEFLNWQYEKSRDLPESDPYGCRQYNQVAGEFQQFQVLLQRFLENEPFQGPRVQNYVKNRCVLRNLLQVPAIKVTSTYSHPCSLCGPISGVSWPHVAMRHVCEILIVQFPLSTCLM
ncbi:uncharacterized protein LOC131231479 isoform X2 [Magnolia sinica]|uniref:uncharacterized protein LOC131231479 isoform X2 n=1 Tax=Magnolia sinica TaxID=86752 RepID=UPI00265B42FC|nr:uncharacterized protein LOC131231479 isoform X2 [Magnolia sinica]